MRTVTVVVGANGGIGSCCVKQLVSRGDSVLLIGRSESAISELAQRYSMPFKIVDPTDAIAMTNALQEIAEKYHIKAVVNCVGSIMLKPIHLLTANDWQTTLNTNLNSAFACVQAAVKVMMPQGGGQIVLFSTAACEIGLANHEAISAAKAGVVGLMKAAAATYAHNKIQVNCIAPGMVDTPLSQRILANPKGKEVSLRAHPLGKIGQPEDVVGMLIALLDNSWATGQVFTIDGGLSAIKPVT